MIEAGVRITRPLVETPLAKFVTESVTIR